MTDRHEEDALRERFQSLRSEQAARAPEFGAMIARARADATAMPELAVVEGAASDSSRGHRSRRWLRLGGWASAALAAAVAAVLLVRPSAEEREFVRLVAAYSAEATWESPTSKLLAVPGIELLNSVPSVGSSRDMASPDEIDDGGRS